MPQRANSSSPLAMVALSLCRWERICPLRFFKYKNIMELETHKIIKIPEDITNPKFVLTTRIKAIYYYNNLLEERIALMWQNLPQNKRQRERLAKEHRELMEKRNKLNEQIKDIEKKYKFYY